MFDPYSKIFDKRGKHYHQAMTEQPAARIAEFSHIINLAELVPGLTVLDIPSGGGYLKNHIACPADIVQIETSKAFYDYARLDESVGHLHCADISDLPIDDSSADRIISLSGLHHIDNRIPVYSEAYRVLRPEGLFCIADVAEGSDTDAFLNIFVDENGSAGHKGLFINQHDSEQIEDAGFSITRSSIISYYWYYPSVEAMVDFIRKMFGIDQCNDQVILDGIGQYLGYEEADGTVQMVWSLQFIQAKKR